MPAGGWAARDGGAPGRFRVGREPVAGRDRGTLPDAVGKLCRRRRVPHACSDGFRCCAAPKGFTGSAGILAGRGLGRQGWRRSRTVLPRLSVILVPRTAQRRAPAETMSNTERQSARWKLRFPATNGHNRMVFSRRGAEARREKRKTTGKPGLPIWAFSAPQRLCARRLLREVRGLVGPPGMVALPVGFRQAQTTNAPSSRPDSGNCPTVLSIATQRWARVQQDPNQ